MIPSLLQIPSAVSDSKLHSVLPNNGKGDFTFDRSTGATRINKDGLIEEVGYFSSELVQNGNFSELGSELVTNGDFATDSNWAKGSGWSINNGKASVNTTTINVALTQDGIITVGKTYKVVYEVKDFVAGSIRVRLGDTWGSYRTANGTYTEYLVATTNTDFRFYATAATTELSIDNVSVKQVDPNDRWTVVNSDSTHFVEFVDAGARYVSDTTSPVLELKQNILTSGKSYVLNCNIAYTGAGLLRVNVGTNLTAFTEGANIRHFTATSNTIAFLRNNANVDAIISNVSVKEVQGDRPRLSYDITNGVVEDKPHLLLEPSRTNLFNYSEPTTNEGAATGVTYESFSWSLGFSNCIKYGDNSVVRFRYGAFVSASTEYTLSAFVVMDDLSEPLVGVNTVTGDFTFVCGGATGGVANENIYYGNNIYRVSTTLTSGANAGNNGIIKYTGQSSKGFRVVGLQVEAGSYSTSYIPTAGTTITRAAETCNNSKPSINSTEGVLYCEIAALADDGTNRTIGLLGDSNNFIELAYRDSSNTIRGLIKTSGAVEANIQHTLSDSTSFNKIACKYKANDVSLYVNGQQVGVDTSASMPSNLNEINFYRFDVTEDFYGKVKGLAVYNEALSESQLMQLTGVTASSIYSDFVIRTASFTVEALNEVKKVIDNL